MLCCLFVFREKKLLCTSCGSCYGLVVKMTLTQTAFDLGERMEDINCTGELGMDGGGIAK